MGFIILFGGNSYEHEISIVSSITLKKELKNISAFVFLDSSGSFYLISKENMKSKYFALLEYKKAPKLELTNGGFLQKSLMSKKILKGVVINLIHGKSGEDGQIAGILDFYNIRFIGPRLEASVLSFNKELTKIYAKNRNVKVLDYKILRKGDDYSNMDLTLPLILKPARLGSSIGISLIKDIDDIDYALDCAFEFDDTVVVESFIPDIKEYNLAGCIINDEFVFSTIEEIKKNEYLDFDKKYLDFATTKKLQEAQISNTLRDNIKNSFKKIYLNCFEGSLIRCDFFAINDEVFLNEINPIPGSMACYLFENFGGILNSLSINLPSNDVLNIQYKYISKIQAIKGK
ncbi:D-alanine--D-alanine ligase A [Helicobacter sp. 16-1353]|uniref:D-alanine--D-alanine ligase n=1 Tax=Helicobacter sp. 16-1353 TaxID=2004996 RepID=UPI000DCBB1AD|nr:D-alanine--D-alanine ligase [Helicobacter sp. 16-1353]RAX54223.1 D-alanine--D-alanine ligase A [Helicobacter sp. 16-1353]